MAKLSDIAKVVIDLRTASIAKASFGIPMIAAKLGPLITDKVLTFTDYNSAVKYTNGSGVKLPQRVLDAIQVVFSQRPRIEKVVIGKLDEQALPTVMIDTAKANPNDGKFPTGTSFAVSVDGTSISYASVADDTVSEVTAGLEAALQANTTVAGNYSFSADPTKGEISMTPKNQAFNPSVTAGTNTTVRIGSKVRGTIEEQLTEIQGNDNSWYGFVLLDAVDNTEYEAAAEWAEAAEPPVQHFAAINDPLIWSSGTSDILSTLQAKQFDRTVVIPTKNDDKLEGVAAMARFYVGEPGQIVAGLKTLVGITPSAFTPQEETFIRNKNGNTYQKYANNVFVFNPGKAVSGRWADEVRDRDWLVNYIQTTMAGALLRAPKIPYTNPGITTLVNVLQGCLVYAQQQGVIAPDQVDSLGNTVPGFVIDAPNALDVPFDVKASRVLNLSFVALLAGAIQSLNIDGVLTYAYDEA